MKKIKFTKETFGLIVILILSSVLNFANIGIEGYANKYYAAGVKSMLMNFRNFFFVSFDPTGFVTIDKPPLGFWIQTISAKIFGFSGWSIILPQALAGVISVGLIYYLVKRSFGSAAGLISALCLAVTPVFVAASRNNTIDNLLVLTLLFACWALSIAAEKGMVKYLIISLVLVGVGFNIKMLEAYMIGPALYITYLLSTAISFKKKIKHLIAGTVILLAVSLSWAFVVDLVPTANRPFVGSSTNNTVMELIFGHNGLERLGLGSKSGPGDGQRQVRNGTDANSSATQNQRDGNNTSDGSQGQGMPGGVPGGDGQGPSGMGLGQRDGNMQPPSGGGPGGGPGGQGGGLQGSFGGQTTAGITRLFSKNMLSDQIGWFLPLAVFGFAAAAIKEKLRFPFNNKRKLALVLWFMWLLPEFIYFSYTKGLFHPYYLTMMAPPIAALSGIGISAMWELYKEKSWKSWILPVSFVVEGLTQLLMLSYFYNSMSSTIKNVLIASLILCFAASTVLAACNIINIIKSKKRTGEINNDGLKESKNIKLNKILVSIAFLGILVIPTVGASTPMFYEMSSGIPAAGLELMSNKQAGNLGMKGSNSSNTKLIEFLKSHKTNEKYLLVVSGSGSAEDIIINTGESVMALGGFSGSDKILTLDQFKELVNKGEIRYVLSGGMGGRDSGNDIMSWVQKNGTVVPESQWKDSNTSNNQLENSEDNKKDVINSQNQNSNSGRQSFGGFDGRNSGQLYDLKGAASTSK
ncbi:glycosyltransferase family 39 protein [Clostridium sp. DJ247]|uniref:glycosyltransferase family 39 protein n=1 Tax=Clostridium sp. DJ247 TaxID=2726188 RepID=UPI001627A03F|nr:glycosyltransferase family 39 protein [Clostridium sp. DJ247]MBC2579451.1 glycosyltransferase family 39 protein [Clostridium sp. DJ247]